MSHDDLRIGIWQHEGADSIAGLLSAASVAHGNTQNGAEWFRWKFCDSPWGSAVLAYAHTSTGQVAGTVAFGTYRLELGTESVDAGVSYETFVHPDFQRRGLFGRLLAAAETEARSRGLHLLFNFPNAVSRPGFLKAGWSDLGGIQTWIKPVNPIRAVGAVLGLSRGGRGFAPAESSGSSSTLALELASVGQRYPDNADTFTAMRRAHDPAFLIWRFATLPAYEYQVVRADPLSALVRVGMRAGRRETQILELFSTDPVSHGAMRQLVHSVATETGADMVTLLRSSGSNVSHRLPWWGFAPVPNRISLFAKPLVSELPKMMKSRRWDLSGVDIHTW